MGLMQYIWMTACQTKSFPGTQTTRSIIGERGYFCHFGETSSSADELKYSLCIGEKNTSDMGAALVHLYWGTGFPWLDLQLRVTLPLTTGFPVTVHTGGEGGTAQRYRMSSNNIGSVTLYWTFISSLWSSVNKAEIRKSSNITHK